MIDDLGVGLLLLLLFLKLVCEMEYKTNALEAYTGSSIWIENKI